MLQAVRLEAPIRKTLKRPKLLLVWACLPSRLLPWSTLVVGIQIRLKEVIVSGGNRQVRLGSLLRLPP